MGHPAQSMAQLVRPLSRGDYSRTYNMQIMVLQKQSQVRQFASYNQASNKWSEVVNYFHQINFCKSFCGIYISRS